MSQKKYYLFNAENFILGRMATKIAILLQGKNEVGYAPNKTGEVFVIVTNADKLNVSGRKKDDKMYHSFSGYPGGITSQKLKDVIGRDSRKAVWESIYGMLPKNKLRDVVMKKITISKDQNHGVVNGQIEEITA
ncbi:MAG: 50S ribosomal protein L13 [Candidatus Moranbacteria bacterium]|nr:50S ribosomal protein L13 [Candidatus Moranbacteria bacterium]